MAHYQFVVWEGKEKKKGPKFSTFIWVMSKMWPRLMKNGVSPNPYDKLIPHTPIQGLLTFGE